MVRTILHQIINQRKSNAWLFIELFLTGIFLLLMLFFMTTKICCRSLPDGYEKTRVFEVEMNHSSYDYETIMAWYHGNDSTRQAVVIEVLRLLKAQPEVENMAFILNDCYPGGYPAGHFFIMKDSTLCRENYGKDNVDYKTLEKQHCGANAVYYTGDVTPAFPEFSDLLGTLRLLDARTGKAMHSRMEPYTNQPVYLSKSLALHLYGTLDCIGEYLYARDVNNPFRIEGVYKDIKSYDWQEPPFSYIVIGNGSKLYGHYNALILSKPLIRLKDDVDVHKFLNRFEQEVKSQLTIGPFSCDRLISLKEKQNNYSEMQGENNFARVIGGLSFFMLLCVFIGIIGTFWVRMNARKGEIEILKAMGASNRTIERQYLKESTLILTIGYLFVLAIFALSWHCMDLDMWNKKLVQRYWWENTWLYVPVVIILTYGLLLLITWIGTWIPVHNAVKCLPNEALKEE